MTKIVQAGVKAPTIEAAWRGEVAALVLHLD